MLHSPTASINSTCIHSNHSRYPSDTHNEPPDRPAKQLRADTNHSRWFRLITTCSDNSRTKAFRWDLVWIWVMFVVSGHPQPELQRRVDRPTGGVSRQWHSHHFGELQRELGQVWVIYAASWWWWWWWISALLSMHGTIFCIFWFEDSLLCKILLLFLFFSF